MSQATAIWSDNRRRWICRIAFLLFCCLPTSGLTYYLFHRDGPQQWQARIQAQLGIKLNIQGVETPTPRITILRGVRIHDPDSHWFPELNGQFIDDISIEFGRNTNKIIFLRPVQIESSTLTRLIQRCSEQLSDAIPTGRPWQIRWTKIAVVDTDPSVPDFVLLTTDLVLNKVLTSETTVLEAELIAQLPAADGETHHLAVQFLQNHHQSLVDVNTHQSPIPTYLLRHHFPPAGVLGNQCHFSGVVHLQHLNGQPINGQIEGDLWDVPLDRLTASSHRSMSGSCHLRDWRCSLRQGRIAAMQMRIVSNGSVSADRSWLQDAMAVGIQTSLSLDSQKVSFAKIDLGVTLQDGQFRLSGQPTLIEYDDGSRRLSDCIAYDRRGQALAICRADLDIPVFELAGVLTGEPSIGNRSIALLDKFQIPNRTADTGQPLDDSYR